MRYDQRRRSVSAIIRRMLMISLALSVISLLAMPISAGIMGYIVDPGDLSEEDLEDNEFFFDVIIQNASIDDGMIEFMGDINSSLITDEGHYYLSLDVNVTLYPYSSSGSFSSVECDTSNSDGRGSFNCSAEDTPEYTMVAETVFDGERYYRYADFDQQDIEEELLDDTDITDNPGDVVFDVKLEDEYEDGRITGDVSTNINEKSLLYISVWPEDSDDYSYDDRQSCTFDIEGDSGFECLVNFTEAGEYNINVTLEHDEEKYSVLETAHYRSPDTYLEIINEDIRLLDDEVEIYSFVSTDGREMDADTSLEVTFPDGSTIDDDGVSPSISFTAEEIGVYKIRSQSYVDDDTLGRKKYMLVLSEEMFSSSDTRAFAVDVSDPESVHPDLENGKADQGRTYDETETLMITDLDEDKISLSMMMNPGNSDISLLSSTPQDRDIVADISEVNLSSAEYARILSRIDFAKDMVIGPMLDESMGNGGNEIALEDIIHDGSGYDIDLSMGSSSSVSIRGVPSVSNISGIKSPRVESERISTDVFSMDGVDIEDADIVLERKDDSDINEIVRCEEWDYSRDNCGSWEYTDIIFDKNETHVEFTVDSFSAYAGGDGFDSELLVWDSSSPDFDNETVLIDEDADFNANYTNFTDGSAIEDAQCDIDFSSGPTGMTYESDQELYTHTRSFSERGNYEYDVMCESDDFDDLQASNDIDVYSVSYIGEWSLTRDSLTLGYSTGVSCKVTDAISGDEIAGYEVDFYSDLDGHIGTQTTDSSGWSSVIFEPESIGEHNISCSITDDEEEFYVAGNEEDSGILDVDLSRLDIEKDIVHEGFNEFTVYLNLSNLGNNKLYDITVSDIVNEEFIPEFNDDPWSGEEIDDVRQGTVYSWDIDEIDGNSSKVIDYTIEVNSTTPFYDLSSAYLFGGTYHIN